MKEKFDCTKENKEENNNTTSALSCYKRKASPDTWVPRMVDDDSTVPFESFWLWPNGCDVNVDMERRINWGPVFRKEIFTVRK